MAQRILVLAPHPDDEVVGCATAIARARARGARVFVLYLTTGVPAPEVEWSWRRPSHAARVQRRRAEAVQAADLLDVEPTRFVACPARRLRTRLVELRAVIQAEIARVRADVLWTSAYEGGHQDHDAANFLASRFALDMPVYEFAEYNNHARRVRSHEFPSRTGFERVLALSSREHSSKRALLRIYRSERRNLGHIGLEREVLRPIAEYDYRRRPHPGVLFYERFSWIPIRHPRVDFTRPEDVCSSFMAPALLA